MGMTGKRLFVMTVTLLAFSPAYAASFKCWTNNEGVRECGNVIPPEYAQKKSETVNQYGVTVETQKRAKTREELAAEAAQQEEQRRLEEEEEKRRKEDEARQREQARKDRVLTATFTSVSEIIASRDRKTQAIDANIEITRLSISGIEDNMNDLKKRAANLERAGKPVPDDLIADIELLQSQIDEKESYIEAKQDEKEKLIEKYEADIERFKELKGIK